MNIWSKGSLCIMYWMPGAKRSLDIDTAFTVLWFESPTNSAIFWLVNCDCRLHFGCSLSPQMHAFGTSIYAVNKKLLNILKKSRLAIVIENLKKTVPNSYDCFSWDCIVHCMFRLKRYSHISEQERNDRLSYTYTFLSVELNRHYYCLFGKMLTNMLLYCQMALLCKL